MRENREQRALGRYGDSRGLLGGITGACLMFVALGEAREPSVCGAVLGLVYLVAALGLWYVGAQAC